MGRHTRFSPFFELSAAQYAVLVLLIAAVLSAELFNTAIENVCDAMTHEKNENIRLAKDIAAGAVLILAVGAVAVAVLFFWNADGWLRALDFFNERFWLLIPLAFSAVLAVLFVGQTCAFALFFLRKICYNKLKNR